MRGLSLVAASGGPPSLWCAGLSLSRPLIAEHRLQTRRLSSRGSRAQLLRGMWDLPRPGLEPVSPALAGRFSTTAPPGKPNNFIIIYVLLFWIKLAYSIMKTCPFIIYHEICLIRCALGKGSYLRVTQCLSRSSFSAVFLIPSLISALTLRVSESPQPQHA